MLESFSKFLDYYRSHDKNLEFNLFLATDEGIFNTKGS